MTISSATKIFYKQSLRDNGLPFKPQANRPGQIHAINPKIAEDGTLILPDDVPEDVKDLMNFYTKFWNNH